ncbi:MAG: TonB-dependent receptor plug domain-containing protein [Flavobacteriales bacterium]|nr:TonB-dependent receptor plug domain-containing protein [Flavobacteriales bacterium]
MKNIAITIAFFLPLYVFANTLSGIVVDEQNEPVPGAQIYNMNLGGHAHSDRDGKFVLENVSIGDTLRATHIGFEDRTVIVTDTEKLVRIVLLERSIALDEVVISPDLSALNIITEIDLQTSPVNSSQEILRRVPGLFIGQHAGGGKAEQIFLRGFDLDHGTDIAISVDGIPVNMVSHAHGQAYADLHFTIPETIEKIDMGKGPYYADQGNFNTAGYVDLRTKEKLRNNELSISAGNFNSQRILGMFKLLDKDHHHIYLAQEYITTDGPFESPQNFHRFNILGKYAGEISDTKKLGLMLSHFNSEWDASGQIPQRAVDNGLISRFGAIDDTEGGITSRTNASVDLQKTIDNKSFIKTKFYYSFYEFELYSNFSFFLLDSVNGDQIRQKEKRDIIGSNTEYSRNFSLGNTNGDLRAGLGFRNDRSHNNELSHTLNRTDILERHRLGEIHELNLNTYVSATFNIDNWTVNPSFRLDHFDYQYNDELQSEYETQSSFLTTLSPKLNVLYNYSKDFQFYFKAGKGFHSNDTRVVVFDDKQKFLPTAIGSDIGTIWKPRPRLLINTALWYLYLQQEYVYVGDEGVIEPKGKTSRIGADLSLRYQLTDALFCNIDANYSHARFINNGNEGSYIPLAPQFTFVSSLALKSPSGFFGSINFRFLEDRPANEDNSIIAKGYGIVDMNAGIKWKKATVGLQIRNLMDSEWNETQFATTSRLQDEPEPVNEIHFTPGAPLNFRANLKYEF